MVSFLGIAISIFARCAFTSYPLVHLIKRFLYRKGDEKSHAWQDMITNSPPPESIKIGGTENFDAVVLMALWWVVGMKEKGRALSHCLINQVYILSLQWRNASHSYIEVVPVSGLFFIFQSHYLNLSLSGSSCKVTLKKLISERV